MNTVLIAAVDGTGSEPEALRQMLEVFGFFAATKYVARPRDMIDILEDQLPFHADYLIISCHGENGAILMPLLGESIYEADEPKCNFSAEEIARYCKLSGKTILNLGCTTGQGDISGIFSKYNHYIAPTDYVAGNSALCFAVRFFYEIAQNKRTIHDAYLLAAGTDEETGYFEYFPNKQRGG